MPVNPTTVTALDGTIISASIVGITAHAWTADSTGLFNTTADLQTEWKADYATMLAGHGDTLNALQRMEGNAEAVVENTLAASLPVASLALFRQDAQREFDATYAAMVINQSTYGIDPTAQFNAYTYLMMEQTLQNNEQLETLGIEGHGLNNPPSVQYGGFTTNFQNKVDGQTDYVGGGTDNGQKAIANFFDDVIITHATFPTLPVNGVVEQLNQNGGREDSIASVLTAVNATTFTRVYTSSDFNANAAAVGAVVLVPGAKAAPPMPVTTPGSGTGAPPVTFAGWDGSILPGTISPGLTVHSWTADGTDLYNTPTDLGSEWKADYAAMLSGNAASLTPLQRMEGNTEAVLENTNLNNSPAYAQAAFRQDMQREYDAIYGAMLINQKVYNINPNAQLNSYTYLKLHETLWNNEQLKELAYQGHGTNSPTLTRYDGYTTDFQNRTDNTTFYVGGGVDNGTNAFSAFLDDVVLTHTPFPVIEINGVQTQLNQNGNAENTLGVSVTSLNESAYNRVFTAGDFSTSATATGPVISVPGLIAPPPAVVAAAAGTDATLDPVFYATQDPIAAAAGLDPVTGYDTAGWKMGLDPSVFFDTNYYLTQNPDVAASGMDPLLHYETYGWKEGREPSLTFSGDQYLAAYADVKAAGVDPLLHYETYGRNEGRMDFLSGGTETADPLAQSLYYDPQLGATLIPQGTPAAQQAAWSYDTSGWQKGLNPDAFFNTNYYLANNPDVAAAHINPLLHYETYGWKEGRNPSSNFDTDKYLAAYADVKAAGVDPLLHYELYGQAEGRTAFSV